MVKDAPRLGECGHLTPEEEDELYRYYGMAGQGSTGDLDLALDHDREATATGSLTTGVPADGHDAGGSEADRDTVGHGTSGPTTDDAMTRSEERLNVGTEQREAGRARLRKYVTTEVQTVQVPVRREEVRLEREPIHPRQRR